MSREQSTVEWERQRARWREKIRAADGDVLAEEIASRACDVAQLAQQATEFLDRLAQLDQLPGELQAIAGEVSRRGCGGGNAACNTACISQADREAAEAFGPMIADWIRFNWEGEARCLSAQANAKRARATGSGFGIALAEWLERWAGEEHHGG